MSTTAAMDGMKLVEEAVKAPKKTVGEEVVDASKARDS